LLLFHVNKFMYVVIYNTYFNFSKYLDLYLFDFHRENESVQKKKKKKNTYKFIYNSVRRM
jgi:hypothetical protein